MAVGFGYCLLVWTATRQCVEGQTLGILTIFDVIEDVRGVLRGSVG